MYTAQSLPKKCNASIHVPSTNCVGFRNPKSSSISGLWRRPMSDSGAEMDTPPGSHQPALTPSDRGMFLFSAWTKWSCLQKCSAGWLKRHLDSPKFSTTKLAIPLGVLKADKNDAFSDTTPSRRGRQSAEGSWWPTKTPRRLSWSFGHPRSDVWNSEGRLRMSSMWW